MEIVTLLLGIFIGMILVLIGFAVFLRLDGNRYKQHLAIEKLHKEIDVRKNLNIKIIEILNHPVSESDLELVDPRSDVKINFADYQFLKNFTSLHTLYIPSYFTEKLFFDLSSHLVIFEDHDDFLNGGYIFRGARVILEDFSVVITSDIENKKKELQKLENSSLSFLRRQEY